MRSLTSGLLGLSALALTTCAVCAQGSAFLKWRDQHKMTFQLSTMVTRGLTECERSKTTEIKPPQAKQLLTVLTPWRSKPKMTQDEARATIQKVQKIFEARQLTAIDRALLEQQRRMASFGGGGGGAARPGGGAPGAGGPPGGRGGNRLPFDPMKAKNFNPFNPAKDSPMYERNKTRNDKLFAFLATRASGKGGKLDLPSFRPGGGAPGGRGGPRPADGAPSRT